MFFTLLRSLIAIVVFVWACFLAKKKPRPSLPISNRLPFARSMPSSILRERMITFLLLATLFFMLLAFINPKYPSTEMQKEGHKIELPREGNAIFILIDISGSMADSIHVEENGMRTTIKKSRLVKEAARQFIEGSSQFAGHQKDLIGLVTFARVASVLSPLTLDHRALLKKLAAIHPVTEERIDGTSIGYAIFKTVSLVVATKYYAETHPEQAATFSIKNASIIVLTDGLQSPNPNDRNNPFRFMRVEDGVAYAKENGIRVYIAEIDPVINLPQFHEETQRLRKNVEATGGTLFIATEEMPVTKILEKIDALEAGVHYVKPQIATTQHVFVSFAPLCLIVALVSFSIALLLETVIIREAP